MATTPGPWVAATSGEYVKRVFQDEHDRRATQFICEMNTLNQPYAENARLIAAAPDLYAALKQIVEHEQIDGTGIRYAFDWNSPLGKQARAALAKADGR